MLPAKLIKDLERLGFELDLPSYNTNEERINAILKLSNERINLAIPLLLLEPFDYEKIKDKGFDKILLIADKIFKEKKIKNDYLVQVIKKNRIKAKISNEEFKYYLDNFRIYYEKYLEKKDEEIKTNIDTRKRLFINKSLEILFSPGKIRIMEKIFNHEKLSNTELKYYYRSIRPLNQAIMNEDMRKYLETIEKTKKYPE